MNIMNSNYYTICDYERSICVHLKKYRRRCINEKAGVYPEVEKTPYTTGFRSSWAGWINTSPGVEDLKKCVNTQTPLEIQHLLLYLKYFTWRIQPLDGTIIIKLLCNTSQIVKV